MQSDRASRRVSASDLEEPAPEEKFFRDLKTCSVVTYSEATLLRLPFTGVYGGKESGVTEVSIDAEARGSRETDGRWHVRSAGLSLPGTTARRVFRALEWTAIDESILQGDPLSNPIFVSPRDVCERLCWHSGRPQLKAIDAALQSLADIRLPETSSPGVNRGASRAPGGRRLLQILTPAIIGKHASSIGHSSYMIALDDGFVESVNRGNVVALNWALWCALEDPVAQRLMEVLESESSRFPDSPLIALDRSTIHRLIPMSPALSPQARERLLSRAHQSLIAAGYIAGVGSPASDNPEVLHYEPSVAWHALRRKARKPAVNLVQGRMDGMHPPAVTGRPAPSSVGKATARGA